MSRELRLYLQDICDCIDKIKSYTEGINYQELVQDPKTLDAVIHNLLIIGEATKQIPDSLRQKYPKVPWRQVAGLRDVIVHTYFKVNTRIIWDIINVELDPLYQTIVLILNDENDTYQQEKNE
ncbi:HepT-like ribonuclease domain-containing protein [Crocosphaera sp.]|uniref:HepT-like ribonuclease domain-containing protein n=1 Tax=Crocosphaera sp. TaxID=2729996 RepID=UPI003F22FEBD